MWLIYSLTQVFLLAFVNVIDENLAVKNALPKDSTIHQKIGSVLLMSALVTLVGASVMALITGDVYLPKEAKNMALLSAIPTVMMYASYFYLLQAYPVHQVIALFQISSIWLIIIELVFGGSITAVGLAGIFILMYGAYVLDIGSFSWKIPTKLLFLSIPATLPWAMALFMVRIATKNNSPTAVTFWQMSGIGTIGILLFLFVKKYRDSFFHRVKNQGKRFLGLSLVNELFAEAGFFFGNLAVAIAPLAAYVTALSGAQSFFVMILLFFFPQGKRSKVTRIQLVAVVLIISGVFAIEMGH
jgi:drug/metabolite transporter (DMT)-like permease